jgi:hypothetical protein
VIVLILCFARFEPATIIGCWTQKDSFGLGFCESAFWTGKFEELLLFRLTEDQFARLIALPLQKIQQRAAIRLRGRKVIVIPQRRK